MLREVTFSPQVGLNKFYKLKKGKENPNPRKFKYLKIDNKHARCFKCILACSKKKCKIGEVYNIGGGKNIKLKDFLKILKSLSKVKIESKIDKKLLRKTDIKTQIPSSFKFSKITGWKPKMSLKNL